MGSVTSRTIEGLGVDGSGRATVAFGNYGDQNLALATFSTTAGSPKTIRTISSISDDGMRARRLVEAPNGVIFIHMTTPGGSGATWIDRINPAGPTYAWTVDPRTRCTYADPQWYLGDVHARWTV